jgi:hypothetical protein
MGNMRQTHDETVKWVDLSESAGRDWVVCLDEIGPANTGVKPDADDFWHDEVRHYALWGNLMAGGGGAEWYFGYQFAHNDLNLEDWRSRDHMWDLTRYALDFMKMIPYTEMRHSDGLTDNPDDYVFASPGVVYAVYLPEGGTTMIHLGKLTAKFSVKWFDPRHGGALQEGSVTEIAGPGVKSIGEPPEETSKDWVALIQAAGIARTFSLTVKGGSGGGSYPNGSAVNIIATGSKPGMTFDRWTGDIANVADASAADTTIVLDGGDATVTATYKAMPMSVAKFVLIDADSNKPIESFDPLNDGATVALSKLPARNLNIRAVTRPGEIGSVRFTFDGQSKTESTAPYALAGDNSGNYNAMAIQPGSHTLTAVPYREANGRGEKGKPLTVKFRVVE